MMIVRSSQNPLTLETQLISQNQLFSSRVSPLSFHLRRRIFFDLFSSFLCHFLSSCSTAHLLRLQTSLLAMENNQSSSNSSGSGVSMGDRMCQCGVAVRMYTSYTKMNHGPAFSPALSINPGLLVRVNHLDDENRHIDTVIVAMEAEIRSLNASILELKAANLALLCCGLLAICLCFCHKMPLTRSQRAEMFACFDAWADHEEGYFIGRLQAAAREPDIHDLATLTDVCRRIAIQMCACLGRRFSLPSLKYKLARIRKDYHQRYSDASWIAKNFGNNGCTGYVFTLGGGIQVFPSCIALLAHLYPILLSQPEQVLDNDENDRWGCFR
ncbi:hypothetical protein ACJIZ3_011320 [Penstemon smallii]|uniref:Uncharacterized protein n=1 Tax=Penstemon smallii TaxID=265156 RepID=A0ABD3UN19_9LAMI